MNARDDFSPGKSESALADAGKPRYFDPPSVREAEPPFLDPANTEVGGATVIVQAYLEQSAGDIVRVDWDGTAADGTKHHYEEEKWLTNIDVGKPLEITVPHSEVERLAGGSVEVTYTVLYHIGWPEQTSAPLVLEVIGKDEVDPNLPRPVVDRVVDGSLDPDAHPGGTVARIPAGVTQANDVVHIVWSGASTYTANLPISGATAGREVPFDIARNFIDDSIGGLVKVRYEIERDRKRRVSRDLIFVVGELEGLPTPQLKDIEGDELELDDVANGGVVQVVPPWPFIAEGQRFWLDLEGTDEDGTPRNLRQANGVVVNAQHVEVGLTNRQVPASYFATLADGSTLRLVFKVAFDGSMNEEDAVTFPVRTYTVGKVPTTLTEDFESTENYQFPVNGTQHLAFMDVTNLNGNVRFTRIGNAPGPGAPVSHQILHLAVAGARVKVEFHFPVRFVRFGCHNGPQGCTVHYYDAHRNLLHQTVTPNLETTVGAWIDYSRDTADIRFIEFTNLGTHTYLDNFTVET